MTKPKRLSSDCLIAFDAIYVNNNEFCFDKSKFEPSTGSEGKIEFHQFSSYFIEFHVQEFPLIPYDAMELRKDR